MASLTIRDLDESLKRKLRIRAAERNRSMEEEARQILRAALQESPEEDGAAFAAGIRGRFAGLGDVRLAIDPREPVRPSPFELREPEAGYAAKDPSRRRAPRAAGSRRS
jgi:plasmid stability protein